jgi:hypothetical protein
LVDGKQAVFDLGAMCLVAISGCQKALSGIWQRQSATVSISWRIGA